METKTIIAYINGRQSLSRLSQYELKHACDTIGISEPASVFSAESLKIKLSEYENDEILLITNFPPDSSYKRSKNNKSPYEKEINNQNAWTADSYEKTYMLYDQLLNEYKIKAIHFITGASATIVPDNVLKTALENIPIEVTRRNKLIRGGNYEKQYLRTIISTIRKYAK